MDLKYNESLLKLLTIAEELLFSFELPSDVVCKYESIRIKTFKRCKIPYFSIVFGKYQEFDKRKGKIRKDFKENFEVLREKIRQV